MASILWKRVRTLGEGGFGVVSLASTSDNQPPTLERLPPLIAIKSCLLHRSQSLQEEEAFLSMFADSPYVIHCFRPNIELQDGVAVYNLLLEYASGGSLADRLHNYNSGKGLSEFEVRKHTRNVVLGLVHIHNRGVIHCDIKPHNILLAGSDEIAKIADFGLSMTLEQSRAEKHGLRGTERYLAPESVVDEKYGPKVDIWALGCTVYELMTGTPLWESEEDSQDSNVLYRIGFEEPMFQNAKLSNEAQDFLKRCLVKNPSSRWTAEMLLNHPFLNSSEVADNNVQPATKTTKKLKIIIRKPQQKIAFKNPSSRCTADMLLNRPFLNSSKVEDNVQQATKTAKKLKIILRRPQQKIAFKIQPHNRDLIIGH
ncbi:mitogen-activated protein kinase kinase kinase 20-like [Nicotiana tabacum]|uniref:Mitogen-activated protein kinase kinase kinase 20-like n=2 Tax=Nicotiana TaxID=4085 RepID=A0A1S4B2M3_TOBAC|nr:PREDICTED: serine/threonine-protein kinase ppk11-like [Nicotiana sylvestris]XP_016483190.1 PREDICTED: serine/threonine-protein kinase ppk11-like [Nicotiana tabacum]